jgi:predicted TIM-barrel fold metal-dependent hydrolase
MNKVVRTASRSHLRVIALATLLLATALGEEPVHARSVGQSYTMADLGRVQKFDAHVHANSAEGALLDQARADGFGLLSINVDYPDFPSLREQGRLAHTFAARSKRFHYATTFSMQGFGGAAWAARTNAALRREVRNGAIAVKVWKNIGMTYRDASRRLVMIDDRRFAPIWATVRSLHVPLIGHQGEPLNCWLPVDQMTTANDRAYFAAHPQYHMYRQPGMPTYEQQMAARDRLLKDNPRLRFVGAHMASMEWSVDRLALFLDTFPTATVDLAARLAQVQHQSVRDFDKVRNFFIRYQDKLLYGTDLTEAPRANVEEFRRLAHDRWTSDWRYLATPESQRIDNIDASPRGLALPREVIDKIYFGNARRVYRTGMRGRPPHPSKRGSSVN